jgi:hypothetical protein
LERLLTQKDLAERWQVTVQSIENCRKEGFITPVKGVPGIRFNPEQIAALEIVKLEKFSPLERRKLERENEELKKDNERLKGIVANILVESSKLIALTQSK